MSTKKVILTGDRPTGPLHLGHYVGSLKNRVAFQETHIPYILIADGQALTDNFDKPDKVRTNVTEVMLDYLSIGIDPEVTTIVLQTSIPEIQELAFYLANMTTVARLSRNPTVKAEIQQRGFGDSLPVGFFIYPISQAADITAFRGQVVPVGEDQKPMIELTNEIVDRFNRLYNTDALRRCEAVVPEVGRLSGTDGKEKMSKSLGNAIYLGDDADTLKKKIMSMYTDPNHLRIEDPGQIEGNTVFSYLDIFGSDKTKIAEMKAHYQRGGLGDVAVKRYLNEVLEEFLLPIRTKRNELAKDKGEVLNTLRKGTYKGRAVAAEVVSSVKAAMGITVL